MSAHVQSVYMRIGIDAGGTFTDFVVLRDDGSLESFKLPSNPRAPARVILAGIERALTGEARGKVDVVHGSTVATNALLERKGARTAFVTTAGFEDLLEIGRQNRPELYNLTPAPRRLFIERALCFGVEERMNPDGSVLLAPSAAGLRRLAKKLQRARVRAIAICFLHSYQNPAHERAAMKALTRAGVYVCASHEISPEFREFERASTTAVNAYVGPLMEAYLSELQKRPWPAHRHHAIERRIALRSRCQPPARAHGAFGTRRRRGGSAGVRALERLPPRARIRHGRNLHRRQPGRRCAARNH